MNRYVSIDEENRICSTTDVLEYAGPDSFDFDFPEDFDFSLQYEYRIVDHNLVHDPIPVSAERRIVELKTNLKSTDYIAAKAMDALLRSGSIGEASVLQSISEEYSDILDQRQLWRDEINDLERRYGLGGDTQRG